MAANGALQCITMQAQRPTPEVNVCLDDSNILCLDNSHIAFGNTVYLATLGNLKP